MGTTVKKTKKRKELEVSAMSALMKAYKKGWIDCYNQLSKQKRIKLWNTK